jgi:hypothetical protein
MTLAEKDTEQRERSAQAVAVRREKWRAKTERQGEKRCVCHWMVGS